VRAHRWLLAIWLCFLARGVFYCLALPLWEGFDEYSHFSYVQHVARGEWLVRPEMRATREVERAIELAPMPWTLRNQPPPHETYESYRRLPAEERRAQERELSELRPSPEDALAPLPAETQQPPLSYWLMAALYKLVAGAGLPAQVLALRLWSLLLTSVAVPAAWMTARRILPGAEAAAAAAVALFPELMFDGARVSNSALSIALYSVFVVLALDVLDGKRRAALGMGAAMGLGLLTKGFFLPALPVLAASLAWAVWKRGLPRSVAAGSLALALAIPGWWYVHNLRVTGSFSTAIQDAAIQHMTLSERLGRVSDVNWFTALDSTFFSHVWFGGWSFLQVRAWIYHVFAAAALVALAGLAIAWRRREPERRYIAVLAALYLLFCGGIAYHVLLTFLANGISSSAGWYLCTAIVPELILVIAGMRALWPPSVIAPAIGFALLDLYGMLFVALPYYSGLIAHRPNGMLESFHIGRFGELPLGAAGWVYVAATVALAALPATSRIAPTPKKRTSAA
jgi:4-amino-4-deoxy-L-arabinose transferase-like glycosyltransferase